MQPLALLLSGLPLGLIGCGPSADPLTADELRDPEACVACHVDHVTEWRGSRHALAASSPMFRALSAQAELALGSRALCLGCHAPLIAAAEPSGAGIDLDDYDETMLGVGCSYCHSIDGIEEPYNNGLVLSDDLVMRGGLQQPQETHAHASAWSPYLDRLSPESSAACGSCHDLVLADGVAFERTYQEWTETLFAQHGEPWALGCTDCHMEGRDGVAAQVVGAPTRRVHSHMFPAIDIPLVESSEAEVQRAAVLQMLQTTLWAELCVIVYEGGALANLTLENLAAGHSFPSGAAQDRRVWVQVQASLEGEIVYQSGVVPDGQSVNQLDDPDLWLMWNKLLDADGEETHLLWEAASYESHVLRGATSVDPSDPWYVDTHEWRSYELGETVPDRVSVQVYLRPMAYDIIDEVIAAGTLDPSMRDAWPTFEVLPQELVWTTEDGMTCVE